MPVERKRERFRKIAEKRTKKILEAIRILGNLSNTYQYEWTERQISDIFGAISEEAKACRNRFRPKGSVPEFSLGVRRNDAG